MKKDYTVALYREDYDHVEELVRRGRMRRYFQGPTKWHQRESVGIVFGGFLSFALGLLIQPLLMNSGLNPMGIKAASFVLILGGSIFLIKGYLEVKKDGEKVLEEVSDEEWEACFHYDLGGIRLKAEKVMGENLARFVEGQEPMEGLEWFTVTGPNDWSANSNLPFLMTVGMDGKIRSSNHSVLVFALGEEHFYIYQCTYNMRDGSIKREHAYTVAYDDFTGAEIRQVEKDVQVKERKVAVHQALEFVIHTEGEDGGELAIIISDLDTEKQARGTFDISSAQEAVVRLNQLARKKLPE